jgi:hypothetical protein
VQERLSPQHSSLRTLLLRSNCDGEYSQSHRRCMTGALSRPGEPLSRIPLGIAPPAPGTQASTPGDSLPLALGRHRAAGPALGEAGPHRARRRTPGDRLRESRPRRQVGGYVDVVGRGQTLLPGETAPAHWHSPAAMEHINPRSGRPVLLTMACWIQLTRSGVHTKAYRQTNSAV